MIGPATETEANLATLKDAVITLNGDEIPVVSSYMYLGGVFRSDLSLDGLVADRNMKAKRAVGAVAPILSNVCIPGVSHASPNYVSFCSTDVNICR